MRQTVHRDNKKSWKMKSMGLLFQKNNGLNIGLQDSENSTIAITLDFLLNFDTLDLFTAQKIFQINSSVNWWKNLQRDTAFLCYWFFSQREINWQPLNFKLL